jgi:hypothetical protein
MHLLFPSDPFNKSAVDEAYSEEWEAMLRVGWSCSLFSFEDFELGEFKPRLPLPVSEELLYRGWMLTPERYSQLYQAVSGQGATLKTHPSQYRRCHYLPEWYSLCEDVTPETVVAPKGADFVALLEGKEWPAYFVKDYVKSLTTPRGSVATVPHQVAEIVSLIEQYRGSVEGGVCVRRFERWLPDTEERYFVFNGQAYAREGAPPALVQEIAMRIESPFFSVDLVQSEGGGLRLIELGDGQVSDRKKWTAEPFASMLLGR